MERQELGMRGLCSAWLGLAICPFFAHVYPSIGDVPISGCSNNPVAGVPAPGLLLLPFTQCVLLCNAKAKPVDEVMELQQPGFIFRNAGVKSRPVLHRLCWESCVWEEREWGLLLCWLWGGDRSTNSIFFSFFFFLSVPEKQFGLCC